MKKKIVQVVSAAVFLVFVVTACKIDSSVRKEETGQWGTVEWKLDIEGTLTFTTEGTFADTSDASRPNWVEYAHLIKNVVFEQPVKAGRNASYLLADLKKVKNI